MFKKALIWTLVLLSAFILSDTLTKKLNSQEPKYIQSCETDGKQPFYICYEKWLTINKQ